MPFSPTDLIRSYLYSNSVSSDDYIEINSFVNDSFARAIRAENSAKKNEEFVTNPDFVNFTVTKSGYVSSTNEVIVGDYADLIDTIFSSNLQVGSEDLNIILPGIRYLSETLLIFERPPTMKPYSYKASYRESANDSSPSEEFFIPIPWQVYVCSFNPSTMRLVSVKMFFTKSSLSSFENQVYAPALLNFYSNGMLCRPFFESMEDIDKYTLNYSGIMASAYDWVWNSGTNFDITENISQFLRSKLFTQFEKYLTSDPDVKSAYNLLQNNAINSNPTSLHPKLVKSFFVCYSQVPIEDVCTIDFTNPSTEDFYYLENNNSIQYLNERFIEENCLFIHENNFDNDYDHDEDCPEECMHYDDIVNVDGYSDFISKNTQVEIPAKDLRFCSAQSILYLVRQGFYNSFSDHSQINRTFTQALSIINN